MSKFLVSILFSGFLFLSVATASVVNPTNLSETKSSETQTPSLLDHFTANYFTIYHGTSLSDSGSKYALDNKGVRSTKNRTNLDGNLSAAYLFNSDIGVGPYVPFLLIPSQGTKHLILGDVGIQAFDKHVIKSDVWRITANVIVQAPTSDYSKDNKMDLGLKFTPYAWYRVPQSNFKFGVWTEEKAYLGQQKGKNFKLWAQPYINYSLADNFSLNLGYEMEAHHLVNKPLLDFTNYQTDLMPGVVWNITKKILFNPYVQIYTGNVISFDNSALGAVLNATFL